MNIYNRFSIHLLKDDLNNLYLTTKDKRIEDLFIVAAKASEGLESNMLKWIRNVLRGSRQANLNRQEVWQTLIVLQDIRKDYPLGIAKPMFAYMIAEDKNLQLYLDMIKMFDKAQQNQRLEILKPYEDILTNSRIIQSKGYVSISQEEVENNLKVLENDYNTFNKQKSREKLVDDTTGYKRKITKSDLIRSLSIYLARRFGAEISEAFNQMKIIDVAGIGTDHSVLRDPIRIIQEVFNNDYEHYALSLNMDLANMIVKEIMNFLDPVYYDHVYNYIRNSVLTESDMMSRDDFNKYIYMAQLGIPELQQRKDPFKIIKNKGAEGEEIEAEDFHEDSQDRETISHDVIPNAWINPDTLVLLSCVLYILYIKIK